MAQIQTIVMAYDFSKSCDAALKAALDKADRFGASLHLVHVIPPEIATPYVPAVTEETLTDVKGNLEKQVDAFLQETGHKVAEKSISVVQGVPHKVIIQKAMDVQADLIVLASHTRSILGYMVLGSVAAKVLRHSPIAVYVDRQEETRDSKKILVTIDETDLSEQAITEAKAFAEAYDATIDLMHVVHLKEYYYVEYAQMLKVAQDKAKERLEALKSEHGLTGEVSVVEGSPSREIVSRIKADHDIGLVVMATHGRKGVEHMVLGSVAEAVLRHSPCPVLSVRELDFKQQTHSLFEKGVLIG